MSNRHPRGRKYNPRAYGCTGRCVYKKRYARLERKIRRDIAKVKGRHDYCSVHGNFLHWCRTDRGLWWEWPGWNDIRERVFEQHHELLQRLSD